MGSHRTRPVGLTLVEMLLTLTLISLTVSAAFLSFRSSISRADVRSLAGELAQELKSARQLARATQEPVALVLPTDGRVTPVTTGFYLMQGPEQARVTRTRRFGQEYQGQIFLGNWQGTETTTESPTVTSADRFDLDAWLGAGFQDYAFVFTASGAVRSNGLPQFGGGYHLAVAHDFDFTPDSLGLFRLVGVTEPYTLTLSSSGAVSVTPGLLGASLPGGTGGTWVDPALPTIAGRGNAPPVVEEVEFYPTSNPDMGGQSGLGQTYVEIHPKYVTDNRVEYSLVSFTAYASDPDGGPLFMRARALVDGAEVGQFTSPGETRMEWDGQRWRGTANWRPPNDTAEATQVLFEVTVTDELGNVDTIDSAGMLGRVRALPPSRIVIETNGGKLLVMNLDGADLVELTPDGTVDKGPVWSADGTKIICFSENGVQWDIVRLNADGTRRSTVTTIADSRTPLSLSPRGTMVATWEETGMAGPPEDQEPMGTLVVHHLGSGSTRVVGTRTNGLAGWTADSGAGASLIYSEWDPGLSFKFAYIAEIAGSPLEVVQVTSMLQFVSRANPSRAASFGIFSNTEDTLPDPPPDPLPADLGVRIMQVSLGADPIPAGAAVLFDTLLNAPEYPVPQEASWTDDGEAVLFVTGENDIWVTGSGGNGALLISLPSGEGIAAVVNPRVSPDGRWLLFQQEGELYQVDLSSSTPRPRRITDLSGDIASYAVAW